MDVVTQQTTPLDDNILTDKLLVDGALVLSTLGRIGETRLGQEDDGVQRRMGLGT